MKREINTYEKKVCNEYIKKLVFENQNLNQNQKIEILNELRIRDVPKGINLGMRKKKYLWISRG